MKKRRSQTPPSLKDIAKKMGISVMTVSYALRPRKEGEPAICSEKTAIRVREVADKMGYVPNRMARAMKTLQTGVIGFVAPHFTIGDGQQLNLALHAQSFLAGLVQELTPKGLHVALFGLNELELQQSGQLPIAMRERFFDALVVHYGLSAEATRLIDERNIPVIYWDSGISARHNCINRNELEAGYQTTKRLIDLGHTRIGFRVGLTSWRRYQAGETMHFSYKGRIDGYTKAIQEAGLRPCMLTGYEADDLARQIEKNRITGIISQTRDSNISTLQAAAKLGKEFPRDLSTLVCDFDQRLPSYGHNTGGALYDRFEVGRTAASLVLKRMDTGSSVPSIRIPANEIVDGGTAGPAPGKSNKKKQSGTAR